MRGGIWRGAKEKGGTVCKVSLSDRDGKSGEGTEYRTRNKWQEQVYKRKWSRELYSGA